MAAEGKHYLQLVSCRGGGASEQLGGGGGGGGQGEHGKLTPLHAPPGKFSNLHALRLNLEPSGGI